MIVASGPSAVAVKGATSTIPIVFSSGDDPVARGLAASLSRPGGNATGVVVFSNELGPKRLGLLRELAPKAGLIAFVVYLHSTGTAAQVKDIQTAAAALGQKILVVNASTPEEVEQAFATIAQEKAGAVLYSAHQFYQIVRDQLVRSLHGTGYRRFTNGASLSKRAASPAIAPAATTRFAKWEFTPDKFSKVQNPPNCRLCRRPNSNS